MRTRQGRGAMAAAVALGLGLAGCGSAQPGGAASTPVGGRDAGTERGLATDPADDLPGAKALPVSAPSDAFRERADALAAVLRASGALATYRQQLVLTDSRVIETGYETDELKVLFGNGGFEGGPELTDTAGTGTLRLADGTSRGVRTVGSRSALALAKEGLPGCAGIEPAMQVACPVTVTRAEAGTREVRTNRGVATVPVWEFWAKGLKTPYIVVSVDEGELASQLPQLTENELSGLPTMDGLLGGVGIERVDGSGITFTVGHGACDRDLAAHVVELEDAVVVGGTTSGFVGACTMQLLTSPATATLSRPLGDRPLIDISGGGPLSAVWQPPS